jgi:uncharacterized protein YjdB
MKTKMSIAVAVVSALVLGGCKNVTTIDVTPRAVMLDAAGKAQVLAVRVLDQNGKPMEAQLTYVSTKPEVATVDATGKVVAVKSGTAIIQVKAGSKVGEAAVAVRIPNKLILSPPTLAIQGAGASVMIQAVVLDDSGQPIVGAPVTFASADQNVVKMAGNIATSAGAGATRIKATFAALSAEIDAAVTVPAFASVAVEPAAPAIKVGDSVQLAATAKDAKGAAVTGVPFTFASSDDKVATVDPAGKVMGLKEGNATITLKAGEKSATAKVAVKKR